MSLLTILSQFKIFQGKVVSLEKMGFSFVTVHIKPASFMMRVKPHTLRVSRYEVTIGQWKKCYQDKVCTYRPKKRPFETSKHPISGVNWLDTQQFLKWVFIKTKQKVRLPTDLEWAFLSYDVVGIHKRKKLFTDPRLSWAADYVTTPHKNEVRTKPVGSFKKNRYGIYDFTGNVWEWTQSCWHKMTFKKGAPLGKSQCGGVHILQGMHRAYQSEFIRIVRPGGCAVGFPPSNIGFRLVQDIKTSP